VTLAKALRTRRFVIICVLTATAIVVAVAFLGIDPFRTKSAEPAPDGTSARAVTVRPCKEANPGPPPSGRVPGSVRLPGDVKLPAGAVVAGTLVGWGAKAGPTFVIGAKGDPCMVRRGVNGGTYMAVHPADGASGVLETWFPGGAVDPAVHGCQYIPQITALANSAGVDTSACKRPPQHTVEPVPTGTHEVYASLVRIPRYAAQLWDVGRPRNDTYALFISHARSGEGQRIPSGQSILCSLPRQERNVCVTSLSYFLTEAASSTLMPDDRRNALAAIRSFLTGRSDGGQ